MEIDCVKYVQLNRRPRSRRARRKNGSNKQQSIVYWTHNKIGTRKVKNGVFLCIVYC